MSSFNPKNIKHDEICEKSEYPNDIESLIYSFKEKCKNREKFNWEFIICYNSSLCKRMYFALLEYKIVLLAGKRFRVKGVDFFELEGGIRAFVYKSHIIPHDISVIDAYIIFFTSIDDSNLIRHPVLIFSK